MQRSARRSFSLTESPTRDCPKCQGMGCAYNARTEQFDQDKKCDKCRGSGKLPSVRDPDAQQQDEAAVPSVDAEFDYSDEDAVEDVDDEDILLDEELANRECSFCGAELTEAAGERCEATLEGCTAVACVGCAPKQLRSEGCRLCCA